MELDVADDFFRSVAGYKQFDVLLVNPVFDGLNLVAKEAFLVNEHDGVLVLSENAGVHEELGEWALTREPSRRRRTGGGAVRCARRSSRPSGGAGPTRSATHVRAHDIREWIDAQLADLDAVRSA